MRTKLLFASAAAVAALATPSFAASVTQSQSFAGDLCATDSDGGGGFDDCSTIAGNSGTQGVFDFVFTGLAPAIGDVSIQIEVDNADLFSSAGVNNTGERFELFLDATTYGVLFDRDTFDEGSVNADLASSVQSNIDNSTGSVSDIDLQFDVSNTLIADGALAVRFDFRTDLNVNKFENPTVTLRYEVAPVPLPASALLLGAGLGGFAALRRRKKV